MYPYLSHKSILRNHCLYNSSQPPLAPGQVICLLHDYFTDPEISFCCLPALVAMLERYSLFHRLQNCSARDWTRRHLLQAYMSSLMNMSGGGKVTTGFMGSKRLSLQLWVDNYSQQPPPRRGTSAVRHHLTCLMSEEMKWRTFPTVLICLSHMPSTWLEWGAFMLKLQCFSAKNVVRQLASTCFRASLSSFLAPTKLLPWSHLISHTAPLNTIKHLRPLIKTSVDMSSNISMWRAPQQRHVKGRPYCLWILCPSLVKNGPKRSVPQ